MRVFVVAIAIALTLACSAPVGADSIESLVGAYAVAGTNVDGSVYTMEARIESYEGNETATVAYFQNGELTQYGFGVRTGNVLSVIFQSADGAIGMATFTITGDSLKGEWMVPPSYVTPRGTETLTRIAALSAPVEIPHEHPAVAPGYRL